MSNQIQYHAISYGEDNRWEIMSRLYFDKLTELIAEGQAKPLKYFAKSPIKKGYALFDKPDSKQKPALKAYFLKAAAQALSIAGEKHA